MKKCKAIIKSTGKRCQFNAVLYGFCIKHYKLSELFIKKL